MTKVIKAYFKRFLMALPATAALCLTFFFFTPVETVMANSSSFNFSAWQAIPVMAAVSAGVMVVLAALLALFFGKVYRILLTACLSVALGIYVQGVFLAAGTPQFTGEGVAWKDMTGTMLINTFIWAIVLAVPFILLHFRKAWKSGVVLLPVLICVMQFTGMASVVLGSGVAFSKVGYLDYNQFCEYSDEANVLVFMLDRLDYEYIAKIDAENPEFFDRLDGFTRYDNAISQFAHTRPAMNFMLTNYDATLFEENADQFFKNSWDDGERHILKDLKDAGYTTNLYAYIQSMLGTEFDDFANYVNNVNLEKDNIDPLKMIKKMTLLSTYRSVPFAMKPFFFHESGAHFSEVFKGDVGYKADETIYDACMDDMSVSSGTKFFKFYEFNGPHPPYYLDENGYEAGKTTNAVTQGKGSFEILIRAFDQMKEAGIYKDSAIIIVADHGDMVDDYSPLGRPTCIGMFYKPAGVEGTPLQRSNAPVSLRNIPATIMKSAGLDYAAYGVPLDEVADDPMAVRDYIRTIADKNYGWVDRYALHYEVLYDAHDLDNWNLKETRKIEYPLGF